MSITIPAIGSTVRVTVGDRDALLAAISVNAAAIVAEAGRAEGVEGAIVTRVAAVEGALAGAASATALGTLAGRVTTAEGNIAATSTALTALTGRVGTAEGSLTALTTRVAATESNISAAVTAATALTTRVGAVETGKASTGDRDATNARVAALETGKASIADRDATNARVSTLETSTAADHVTTVALVAKTTGFDAHFVTVDERLDNAETQNGANARAIVTEATARDEGDAANAAATAAETTRAQAEEGALAGVDGFGAPIIRGLIATAVHYDDDQLTIEVDAGDRRITPDGFGGWAVDGIAYKIGDPIAFSDGVFGGAFALDPASVMGGAFALDPMSCFGGAFALGPSGFGAPILDPDHDDSVPIRIVSGGDGSTITVLIDGPATYVATSAGFVRIDESGDDQAEPAAQSGTAPTFVVPAASIPMGGGLTFATNATAVTSPLPATEAVTGFAVPAGAGVETWLLHEAIVSVDSIAWADGHTPAPVAGTDYSVDMNRGAITNISAAAKTLGYTAYKQRKDIVSADPVDGAVTITLGTEVRRAADAWRAAMPAGNVEIGRVFNTGTQIDYVPTWRWSGGHNVAAERRAADADWLDRSRRAVARTRANLLAGIAVRVILVADSRGEMGGNGPFGGGRNTHPNSSSALGISRDVPGYFALYDTPTRTLFQLDPASLLDFNDGLGAVHSKRGYTWEMLRALEQSFGISFTAPNGSSIAAAPTVSELLSFSIGGTSSAATQIPNGSDPIDNGLYAERWNAAKAAVIPGRTLFINGMGMNELGSAASFANFLQMASEMRALGADCLHISTTRPDRRFSDNVPAWQFTCRETVRAAIAAGSAWVDASELVSPANLVGLGLAEREICNATLINHEGIPVQQAIGRRAAEIFI